MTGRGRRVGAAGIVMLVLAGAIGCGSPRATPPSSVLPSTASLASPATLASATALASPPAPAPATPGTEPAGGTAVSTELSIGRAHRAERVISVQVTNTGDGDLPLIDARLDTPWFTGSATARRVSTIGPGLTRSLLFGLGEAAGCTGPADPDLTLVLDLADGRHLTVHPVDDHGQLTDLHDQDCAAALLSAAGTVTIDRVTVTGSGTGAVASVVLTLAPRPGAAARVRITTVHATTLLRPAGGDSWTPTGLASDAPGPVAATLDIRPARCDQHAVAEDKRGTVFGVEFTVNGVPQPAVDLPAPASIRSELYAFVTLACGWPKS